MLTPAALPEWAEWTINKVTSYRKAPQSRGFLFLVNLPAGLCRIYCVVYPKDHIDSCDWQSFMRARPSCGSRRRPGTPADAGPGGLVYDRRICGGC